MSTTWQVQVREAGSTDLVDTATVTFLPASEVASLGSFPFDTLTGSHRAGKNKIYRAIEEPIVSEELWLLVVTAPGKSPVIQPIALKASSVPVLPASTSARGLEATTVEISPATPTSLFDFVVTFLVTLHPASEVVLVSATQYDNPGRPLRAFAEARRALLYGKRTNDGTLVTIFSFDDRRRETFVKAMPRSDKNQWLRIHSAIKGPLPPDIVVTPGAPWQKQLPNGDLIGIQGSLDRSFALSILDLYEYLEEVGTKRPRSVKEVSFFSHGWRGGPILYNTSERTSFTRAPQRDPRDFDGRPKDFNATHAALFPNLPRAMATGSSWHIWGCQVWNRFIRVCVAAHIGANRTAAPDKDLTLSIARDGINQQDVTTKQDIRRIAARAFTDLSYAGSVAARLGPNVSGVKVFASMPGTWSNFIGLTLQVADDSAFKAARQYFSELEPEFASRLRPSSGLDGVRYVDYVPMRDVPVPAPRPSAQHFSFQDNKTLTLYDWVFGNISLGTKKPTRLQRQNVRVDVAAQRVLPPAAAGTPAVLYILTEVSAGSVRPPIAVVVFVDGPRVLVHFVDRGPSGNFEVLGEVRPLPFGVP